MYIFPLRPRPYLVITKYAIQVRLLAQRQFAPTRTGWFVTLAISVSRLFLSSLETVRDADSLLLANLKIPLFNFIHVSTADVCAALVYLSPRNLPGLAHLPPTLAWLSQPPSHLPLRTLMALQPSPIQSDPQKCPLARGCQALEE